MHIQYDLLYFLKHIKHLLPRLLLIKSTSAVFVVNDGEHINLSKITTNNSY